MLLILACSPVWAVSPDSRQPQDASRLVDEMLAAVGHDFSSASFRMKDFERIGAQIKAGEERVKISRKPLRLYFGVLAQEKGAEVLWREGENSGKAWVHPAGFPYVTMSLDPWGSVMRTGHHSLFSAGPWYFSEVVAKTKSRFGAAFSDHLRDEGDDVFDGRKCRKIAIEVPEFAFSAYRVKPGENIDSIAERAGVSAFLILTKNPGMKDYRDARAGQEIQVPNAYAARTVLRIDIETKLPLSESMYDDAGLFEKYEYYDFKMNPIFDASDFSRNNPAYHF